MDDDGGIRPESAAMVVWIAQPHGRLGHLDVQDRTVRGSIMKGGSAHAGEPAPTRQARRTSRGSLGRAYQPLRTRMTCQPYHAATSIQPGLTPFTISSRRLAKP